MTPLGAKMQTKIKEYLINAEKQRGRTLKISLLGYGITNQAILGAIRSSGIYAEIKIRTYSKICDTPPCDVEIIYGEDAFEGIDEDILFASPSVRRERLCIPEKTIVTSDTDLFFDEGHSNLFLVSGSDGKSTVTTLTSFLLFPTFPTLFTGGNIGTPTILADLRADAHLLELSSFNLRYCTPKGGRALLTNVRPNHLNWHTTLHEYEACKAQLIRSADEAILTLSCPFNMELAKSIDAYALVSMNSTDKELRQRYSVKHTVTAENGVICLDGSGILPICSLKRRETHNVENFMSAIALTIGFVPNGRIAEVGTSFKGLEHRCEHIALRGVDYVNSSIDTTPDRTRATLEGLDRRVTLLVGGRGKGLSFDPMKDTLIKYADRIVAYGEISKEICEWLDTDPALSKIPHVRFEVFTDALEYADGCVTKGDTLLLSPAATAYGEFKSFAERGRIFKEYLRNKHT